MAKFSTDKPFAVEKELDKKEFAKDKEVLTEIADKMPSAAKLKIFKISEDGEKQYIKTYPAANFDTGNIHEFVQKKFVEKYGGGEYVIEALDGQGNSVGNWTISIIKEDEQKSTSTTNPVQEAMGKVLDMKEAATDKLIKAEEKMREVEKTKYETAIESMSKQWDQMAHIYEQRISDISEQKKSAPEFMQMMLNNQIDGIRRDMDSARERMMSEISKNKDADSSSDKVYSLLNTLIPLLIKDKPEKDPIETLEATMNVIGSIAGDRKDFLESMLEDPNKLSIFKQLMGLNEQKKDFFEELVTNPMKAAAFKQVMGIEDKKDFMTEMISNPEKFAAFKAMFGLLNTNEVIEMERRNTPTPPPRIEPVDPLTQMIEFTTKIKSIKDVIIPLLGIPTQPARSPWEFLSSLFSGIGPQLANMVTNVAQSMITVSAINKGLVNDITQLGGQQNINERISTEKPPEIRHTIVNNTGNNNRTYEHAKPINNSEPFSGNYGLDNNDVNKHNLEENVNIELMFEEIITNVATSLTEQIPPEEFCDKVVNVMMKTIEENPRIIVSIMKYKNKNENFIVNQASSVFCKVLNLPEEQSNALATVLSNKTQNKFKEMFF